MKSTSFYASLVFSSFFLLEGCSEESDSLGSDATVLQMDVEGKVYNEDPNASVYKDVYGDSSVDVVSEDMEKGDPYATYLLGTLYFTANPRYGLERDTERGRELLEKAWRMGVVDSGYSLYQIYSQGLGVEKNLNLGLRYLRLSAGKSYVESQFVMAEDYFGRGDVDYFETDYEEARFWFTKAAEAGDRRAGVALAKIYNNGLGVEENDDLAFEWMSRVEDMEYGSLSFALGGLAQYYEEGVGTNIDLVKAYKYYDLRGTAGIPDKQRLADQMSPEQIDQAVRLSGEWQREYNISMPNSEGYRYR